MSKEPAGGRLVLNHSTHVEGLIPVLQTLTQQAQIKTVTPGVISRAKSNSPTLQLRISVATRGGFKLVARKGKSVQEVFVVTTLNAEQLQQVVTQCLT